MMEKPKKKKLKHLTFAAENNSRVRDKIISNTRMENAEIRKALNAFLSEGVL